MFSMNIKKLLGIIFLSFIFMSKTYGYDYCDAYLKTSKPLDNPSFVNISLLKFELKCLGKDKEALIFDKEMTAMMEKHLEAWVKIMIDPDENDKKIANQMEQDYINSVVELFYKLRNN